MASEVTTSKGVGILSNTVDKDDEKANADTTAKLAEKALAASTMNGQRLGKNGRPLPRPRRFTFSQADILSSHEKERKQLEKQRKAQVAQIKEMLRSFRAKYGEQEAASDTSLFDD